LNSLAGVLNVRGACQDVGVHYDRLDEPIYRVPIDTVAHLWDLAAAVSGDALLGLHTADRVPAPTLLGYLMQAQPTSADALATACEYHQLVLAGQSVSLRQVDGRVEVIVWAALDRRHRHMVEYFLALLYGQCRHTAVPPLVLRAVRFRHSVGGDRAEYHRVFGCPVHFDQPDNALVVDGEQLHRPLVTANALVARALREQAHACLEIASKRTTRERVEVSLRRRLWAGDSAARAAVARELGMSSRTLQRRLEEESVSFRDLRRLVTVEVATELIERSDRTISDVATRVGFSGPSAFQKAFRFWTGRNPSTLRHRTWRPVDMHRTLSNLPEPPAAA